jgi:hypothetical protein
MECTAQPTGSGGGTEGRTRSPSSRPVSLSRSRAHLPCGKRTSPIERGGGRSFHRVIDRTAQSRGRGRGQGHRHGSAGLAVETGTGTIPRDPDHSPSLLPALRLPVPSGGGPPEEILPIDTGTGIGGLTRTSFERVKGGLSRRGRERSDGVRTCVLGRGWVHR